MIQLASIFSDGAVLQRNMQIPVWGKTTPKTIVHAVCGNAEGYTKSSADGRFTVYLPALQAGGPLELIVSTDTEKVSVRDILVGEVWIAGGQSNMEYRLDSDISVKRPAEGETLLSRIQEKEFLDSIQAPEQVRSIVVPRVASSTEEDSFCGMWKRMTKENAPEFSAVGAWFAKTVQEKLHVPVGIIECNWGGTIAETWTSRNGLMRNPETATMLRETDTWFRKEETWRKSFTRIPKDALERYGARDTGNQGFAKGWAKPDLNDEFWKDMNVPGSWIHQKISGNGILWARRSIEIPKSWEGKPLLLHLGPVDKQDTTYFNGTEIGRTGDGFETAFWNAPREYSVPAELVKAGHAVIAIRAYSFMYDGSISGSVLENPETKESIDLAGVWKAFPESDFGIVVVPEQEPEIKYIHGNPNVPATLFNCMLRPLIPYAMRGTIWYQGESNAKSKEDAASYYAKLRIMIEDWRYLWAQGNFPFIQMILANYREPKAFCTDDAWPILREAQIRLCSDMPEVYAASAIDIGDANDIHPLNKKDAGLRMARIALSQVYHITGIVPAGPRFRKYALEGNMIRLEFDNAAGLAFRGGQAKGFFLTDAKKQLLPPESVSIENDTVLVRYKEESFPKELYYSWADNPDGNLENEAGLPADPFHILL